MRYPSDNLVTVVLSLVFGAAVGCWARGWHDSRRELIGGHRCRSCGKPGADMEAMGTLDDDMLHDRRLYDRINGLTRYQGFRDE